jgi:hypothetical protein
MSNKTGGSTFSALLLFATKKLQADEAANNGMQGLFKV